MYGLGDEVTVEADRPVRLVTMNRPEKLNAFNVGLHRGMVEVWRSIAHDPDARAVALTGAGPAFSVGGDVDMLLDVSEDVEFRRHMVREGRNLVDAMARFHLPVVAAVNGPVVGLGCSVAVLCDIVPIADSAYMADPHVPMGMVAAMAGP